MVRGENTFRSVSLSGYQSLRAKSLYDSKSYNKMSMIYISVIKSVTNVLIVMLVLFIQAWCLGNQLIVLNMILSTYKEITVGSDTWKTHWLMNSILAFVSKTLKSSQSFLRATFSTDYE